MMDFSLTDDRRMLADTLTRWLADEYPIEHRNSVAYDAPYHDIEKWASMAELGAVLALADERVGGFGGSGFDISVVFEALGRALCPEPVLGALLASRLLAHAGLDQEGLLDGSVRYAVAVSEPDAPYDTESLSCTATAAGDGYSLSGRKTCVYGGNDADVFLIAARVNGALGVFSVQANDASVVAYGMMDGGGAAELLLDATPATLLIENAEAAVEAAENAGIVALCAEAVGAMSVVHDTTLDYLRTRKQFGVPIAKFQVLQHRAVDMLTEIEQARSIVIKAASELDRPEATRFASMAKHLIGRAARLVAEEAIQMHGGIAMTWEYPISHYAKRLVMLDAQLGDTDEHLARLSAGYSA